MKELQPEAIERTVPGTEVPVQAAAPLEEGADPDQYLWGV